MQYMHFFKAQKFVEQSLFCSTKVLHLLYKVLHFVEQSLFYMSANEYRSPLLILLNYIYIFSIQKHTVLIYKMTSKWMMIVFACPPA